MTENSFSEALTSSFQQHLWCAAGLWFTVLRELNYYLFFLFSFFFFVNVNYAHIWPEQIKKSRFKTSTNSTLKLYLDHRSSSKVIPFFCWMFTPINSPSKFRCNWSIIVRKKLCLLPVDIMKRLFMLESSELHLVVIILTICWSKELGRRTGTLRCRESRRNSSLNYGEYILWRFIWKNLQIHFNTWEAKEKFRMPSLFWEQICRTM